MYLHKKRGLVCCKWDIFREYKNLVALFSTRKGGVSKKPYDSLNIGFSTDDNKENVTKNRDKFFYTIGVSEKETTDAMQVHGDNIIIVEKPGNLGVGDGLITDVYNIFLTGTYADCASVLIFEPYRKVVGLLHIGWRGLFQEVSKKCIYEICRVYNIKPDTLLIGISPHIKQCCYIVHNDVANLFNQEFLIKTEDQCWKFSIENVIIKQLLEVGVNKNNIEKSAFCSSCYKDMFFSYRRDKGLTGRMMAVIGIKR